MDTKENTTNWSKIVFIAMVIILIASNVGIIRAYKKEHQRRVDLQQEVNERKQHLESLGLAEVTRWQAELKGWQSIEQGLHFFTAAQYADALAHFAQAIKDSPDMEILYYLRGYTHLQLQNYEQATQDFTTYVNAIPFSTHGYFLRAQCYYHQQQFSLAQDDVDTIASKKTDWQPLKDLQKKIQEQLQNAK
jgi:tetratricopeptide (TPR) repeat protein